MKKIISSLVLIMALVMSLASGVAADINDDAYSAYYNILREKKETVGFVDVDAIYNKDYVMFNEEGVYYARLLDFDLDGTYELIVFECVPVTERPGTLFEYTSHDCIYTVYTYRDGQMVEVTSGDASVSVPLTEIGFQIDGNGKPYLVYHWREDNTWIYGTIINGEWTTEEIHTQFIPTYSVSGNVNGQHVYAHTSTGRYIYYIGKTEVSEDEFSSFQGFKRQCLNEMYSQSQSNPFPGNAINNVLDELASLVPESARHYDTPSDWAGDTVNLAIESGYVDKDLQKNILLR